MVRSASSSRSARNICSSAAPNATTSSEISAAIESGPAMEKIRTMPIARAKRPTMAPAE
jgi:hypothetical protein